MENITQFTAVVLAAGSGSRMKSGVKKQYMDLCGKPVIIHSLEAFEANKYISSIVLVVGKGEIPYAMNLCLKFNIRKVRNIVEGGDMRFRSVYNGIAAAPENTSYVLIHDGARPLISDELIDRICDYVVMTRACVAAVPVKDTIKSGDSKGFCVKTLDRSNLWQVQTPQAFSFSLIKQAYKKLFETIEKYHPDERTITDDAVIVENMTDCRVRFVSGDYRNIKITTPEDLLIARAFLST